MNLKQYILDLIFMYLWFRSNGTDMMAHMIYFISYWGTFCINYKKKWNSKHSRYLSNKT